MKKVYNKDKKLWEAQLTEEHIIRQISEGLSFFRFIKFWRVVERIPWGIKKSTRGIPDICGVVIVSSNHPIPLFIEVKKPGGERKQWQKEFIHERSMDGCIAMFAECWEDVVKEFSRHGFDLG